MASTKQLQSAGNLAAKIKAMCQDVPEIIRLADYATFEHIANVCGATINKEFKVEVSGRKLVVVRKCTYANGEIKTSYRHIMRVKEFGGQVVEHWREDKKGNFKTI